MGLGTSHLASITSAGATCAETIRPVILVSTEVLDVSS